MAEVTLYPGVDFGELVTMRGLNAIAFPWVESPFPELAAVNDATEAKLAVQGDIFVINGRYYRYGGTMDENDFFGRLYYYFTPARPPHRNSPVIRMNTIPE